MGNDYVSLCPAGGGSARARVHLTVSASIVVAVVVVDRFHTILNK